MEGATSVFQLTACRELMATYPQSLVIKKQVEALEDAMPDKPGIAISFCRTLIETTCKTILVERGQQYDNKWNADKLWLETKSILNLGQHDNGTTDRRLHNATEKIVSGFNSIFEGIITCLLYTSPSPRDRTRSRMPSSA